MGPLPRDLDEYPEALAEVDRLAGEFDSVEVARRTTPATDWLLTCREAGQIRALYIVDEHGAVRAAC